AMAAFAAGWPDQLAVAAAVVDHVAAIGMGEAERGVERGAAAGWLGGIGRLQGIFHPLHGAVEVAGHAGPVGGIDAWITAERVDAEAGIVAERQHAGTLGRGMGLEPGVFGKGGAGFLGLGQAELSGGDELETE